MFLLIEVLNLQYPIGVFLFQTTGLTGLKVLANPREVQWQLLNLLILVCKFHSFFQELMSVYNKIIKTLQQVPDSAAYKSYTLATVNDRLKIVQNVRIYLFILY